MSAAQTISIRLGPLAVMQIGKNLPLGELAPNDHIHGGFVLLFGERPVPYLGYFGPNDVCINGWLAEIWKAARSFESSTHARHVFDECEQGQPAYVFEREDDRAYFTIADSEFAVDSGGRADPDWQRVEFSSVEFLGEHTRFREALFAAIRAAAPQTAEEWLRQNDPGHQAPANRLPGSVVSNDP